MCKLRKRRGFTLTELAIVIAIIAVLIAVLVPTFYTLIKNAKESSDSQLTKNMNEAITIEDATNTIETPEDAITAALSVGYSVENLSAKSEGNIIVYDQESTRFVLISEDLKTVVYKDSSTTKMGGGYGTATTWLFLETTNSSVVSTGTNGYDYVIKGDNSYLRIGDGWAGKTIQVKSASGIDTSQVSGADTKVETTYVSSQAAVTPELAKKAITASGIAGTEYPLIYNIKSAHLTYKGGVIDVKIYGSYYVSLNISSTNSNTITVANTVSYVDVTGSASIKVDIQSGGSTKLIAYSKNVTVTNTSGTSLQVTIINEEYKNGETPDSLVTNSNVYEEDETPSKTIAATCTEQGYTEYYYVNKYTGDKVTVIGGITDALGHNYSGTWEWTEDYSSATLTLTCANDSSHTHTETITPSTETTNATCTEDGSIKYTANCTYDSKTYTDTKSTTIAATGHSEELTVKAKVSGNTIYIDCEYICSACTTTRTVSDMSVANALADSEISAKIKGQELTTADGCWTFVINSTSDITLTKFTGSGIVTVPAGVTAIGEKAFANCKDLTDITITEDVKTIGASAFFGCSGLTSMKIPFVGGSASATTVDETTLFGYIFGTTSFDNAEWSGQYIEYSSKQIYYYIPKTLETVVVTGSTVLYGAFSNCHYIKNITLSGVTALADYVCFNCYALASVNYANNITAIGERAFASCTALSSITIPDTVATIGFYAFSSCQTLTEITIPESVTYIANGAFNYCINLQTIKYKATNATVEQTTGSTPPSSNSIFQDAGDNYSKGITVTIDANVQSIPAHLFYSNTDTSKLPNIVKVTFSSGSKLTTIGDKAFYNIGSLTSLTYTQYLNNLESIGTSAFAYTSITSFNASSLSKVTSIGSSAFEGTAITSFDSGALTLLGNDMFRSCKSLTTVTLGSNLTSVGNNVFTHCDLLETVYYNCSNLGSVITTPYVSEETANGFTVYIDEDVTSIGSSAFNGATTLKNVVFRGNKVTTIGSLAFRNTGLTSITLPESLTEISTCAFENTGITTIALPDSLTTIGYGAFTGCTNLVKATISKAAVYYGLTIGNSNEPLVNAITLPNTISVSVDTSATAFVFESSGALTFTLSIPTSGTYEIALYSTKDYSVESYIDRVPAIAVIGDNVYSCHSMQICNSSYCIFGTTNIADISYPSDISTITITFIIPEAGTYYLDNAGEETTISSTYIESITKEVDNVTKTTIDAATTEIADKSQTTFTFSGSCTLTFTLIIPEDNSTHYEIGLYNASNKRVSAVVTIGDTEFTGSTGLQVYNTSCYIEGAYSDDYYYPTGSEYIIITFYITEAGTYTLGDVDGGTLVAGSNIESIVMKEYGCSSITTTGSGTVTFTLTVLASGSYGIGLYTVDNADVSLSNYRLSAIVMIDGIIYTGATGLQLGTKGYLIEGTNDEENYTTDNTTITITFFVNGAGTYYINTVDSEDISVLPGCYIEDITIIANND